MGRVPTQRGFQQVYGPIGHLGLDEMDVIPQTGGCPGCRALEPQLGVPLNKSQDLQNRRNQSAKPILSY